MIMRIAAKNALVETRAMALEEGTLFQKKLKLNFFGLQ